MRLLLAAAALTSFVAAPASAATYLMQVDANLISIRGAFKGSLTLTTSDTKNANGSYTITGASGTIDYLIRGSSASVTGLSAFRNANQQLFVNGTGRGNTVLDSFGLGLALSDGNQLKIGSANQGYSYSHTDFRGTMNSLTLTPVASAVPEPAVWATMILGLGMAGTVLRRRRVSRVQFA